MLLEIFIIEKNSSVYLLRRSFTRRKIDVDGVLFSGFISALTSFINDLNIGQVKVFETGEHKVLISHYEGIFVVGIVEESKEKEFIERTISKISEEFWSKFKEILLKWNFDVKPFQSFTDRIDEIVYSEFTKEYISKDFPKNIIKSVRAFQNKFEPHIIRNIGFMAGKVRGSSCDSGKMLKKKLKKEINLFSISDLYSKDDNEIICQISMCPICRGIKEEEFSCKFIEGFIHGFISNCVPEKKISVNENQCIAHEDESCSFKINID